QQDAARARTGRRIIPTLVSSVEDSAFRLLPRGAADRARARRGGATRDSRRARGRAGGGAEPRSVPEPLASARRRGGLRERGCLRRGLTAASAGTIFVTCAASS